MGRRVPAHGENRSRLLHQPRCKVVSHISVAAKDEDLLAH